MLITKDNDSMDWKERAFNTLNSSLKPVPIELNELDWKSGLSPKTERLAQHISAFANHRGGGFLVFGVNNDGTLCSILKHDADDIIKKLGNIARNNLEQFINIEHAVMDFEGYSLLFIYIPENNDKPVYLRGTDVYSSYCRSAGQTVKMSKSQIKMLIATSLGYPFEKQIALDSLSSGDVLKLLNYKKVFELFDKNIPQTSDIIMNTLREFNFCNVDNHHWHITNLGAILFANNLKDFESLQFKSLIIRKYFGPNNIDMEYEHISHSGYAIVFDEMIDTIMKHIVKKEVRDVRRFYEYFYPKVAIREFVANALIHQDFAISGMQNTVEIFSDRLSITNPGAPLNDIKKLIHLPPNSRNEILANTMYLLKFCEKRGSGINKAFEVIDSDCLPAVLFSRGENHTQVTMYPAKSFSKMTTFERINVCYQHACLQYKKNMPITNQSLRERFGLDKNKTKAISYVISDTIQAGYIKPFCQDRVSRKLSSYIPYYG